MGQKCIRSFSILYTTYIQSVPFVFDLAENDVEFIHILVWTYFLAGFVFVCFMKYSPGGFQRYIKSFLRITMTTVTVNVVFVLLVAILIHSPLVLSWDLCFVHLLFDFMALPSRSLTGTVSITSMISFAYLLTFEVFERQVLFCVSPVLQLWFVPLKQAGKSFRMSSFSFALWWRRGGVLDVWAGWFDWTICFQCGYWLHHARSTCSTQHLYQLIFVLVFVNPVQNLV